MMRDPNLDRNLPAPIEQYSPVPYLPPPVVFDGEGEEGGAAGEYSLLVEVQDDRGVLLARRVVGVGRLKSGDVRKVTVRFEVQVPENPAPPLPS